jgi:hypothetical protein
MTEACPAQSDFVNRGLAALNSLVLPHRGCPCSAPAVTCHQDEHNRGMVDAKFLAACKPGVRIVNVARGALGRVAPGWQPGWGTWGLAVCATTRPDYSR